MNVTPLKLKWIEEDVDQPRYKFDEEALQELMDSIRELGLLSPIKVRIVGENRYRIIYGNRRFKACQKLGFDEIPCIISSISDEKDIYLEQVAENLSREDFNPIEEAEAFDKLLHDPRFSSSIKFLSSKLGKTETYIRNKCELLKFSPAVRALVVSGTQIRKDQLTEDQLIPLRGVSPEYLDSLAMTIARDELPVSDVKKIAKLFKDKEISTNVKSKLLYKDGPGLLETWSVVQQNKKENAKAAKMKQQQEQERLQAQSQVQEAQSQSSASDEAVSKGMSIDQKIQKWLRAISAPVPVVTAEDVHVNENLPDQLDCLITTMEQRLAAWKEVRSGIREDNNH